MENDEKTECKKCCCSFFKSTGLTLQTNLMLIILSIISIFLIAACMILNIFLVSSYTYKEIYKIIDTDEFNELTFAENNLENIQLQFENTFKSTLLSIINLYKELSNTTIRNDYFSEKNNNFKLSYWNGQIETSTDIQSNNENANDEKKIMLYTCDIDGDESGDECKKIINGDDESNDISYNYLSYLGIYLEKIFTNKKIFMNYKETESFMHLLIICDYTDDNAKAFYYPAYIQQIKKIDKDNHDKLKGYVIDKIIQKIKDISMYQDISPNNINGTNIFNYYDNLFLLPYFDDDDNEENTFPQDLANIIFNENYLLENKINEVAFMLLPKRDTDTEQFKELDMETINDNIGQIFILIGIEDINNVITEKLNNQNSKLYLLRTNYLFPYYLISKDSCKDIKKYMDIDSTNSEKYLNDCFNEAIYNKTIKDFGLFRNDNINNYNSNYVNFLRIIEKRFLQKKNTSFSKSLSNATKISKINEATKKNETYNFKIKKTYSPLNIIYQINYFYPIDNIKMHILLKEENHLELIEENKKIMKNILFFGGAIVIAVVVIIEVIVLIILRYFINELEEFLNTIKKSDFILGQIKEEKYKKIHTDEFKELIKSVNEALKSEMEYKQKINKKEEDDMKLEMEYLNKEFEKNKIFNIMVDENKINNILEESNYSNEIIKHKTNLENVKNDSFVKKSHLFREFVNIDDFGEFDNSGENSFTTDNTNLFKDENSLQNPNSLFYDLFKREFDENYAKKDEEIESKKKNKNRHYTFKFEDNGKDKSAKKSRDFESDFYINTRNKNKRDIFEKETENENKLDNYMNKSVVDDEEEIKFTDDLDEKEFEYLLRDNHNNRIKTMIEDEIDTTSYNK